jgi:hypothetical protein
MIRRLSKSFVILMVATLAGCDSNDPETRDFRLEYLTPADAMALVRQHLVAEAGEIRIAMHDDAPRTLSISAPAGHLAQVETLLSTYDVPGPDVRLRFQLIEADGFTDVDPAIAEVEAALRELFRFGGYRLVSEALMTVSQHSQASQRLIGFDDVALYLETNVGRIISGDHSSVELRVRLGESGGEILSTSVVVPDGQTVVLGTARPFEDRGALILVVRPEIQ